MACIDGKPHAWAEVYGLRIGNYVRILCVFCLTKKWKRI